MAAPGASCQPAGRTHSPPLNTLYLLLQPLPNLPGTITLLQTFISLAYESSRRRRVGENHVKHDPSTCGSGAQAAMLGPDSRHLTNSIFSIFRHSTILATHFPTVGRVAATFMRDVASNSLEISVKIATKRGHFHRFLP